MKNYSAFLANQYDEFSLPCLNTNLHRNSALINKFTMWPILQPPFVDVAPYSHALPGTLSSLWV